MPDVTIRDIFEDVQTGLAEAGLKWFSEDNITDAIQEGYNRVVSLLKPIEYSTFIPKADSPHYNLRAQIPDFMSVAGIYNPANNRWLEGIPENRRQGLPIQKGQPLYFNVVDLNRITVWPFLGTPTGALFLLYKAIAPTITMDHTPILPNSTSRQILAAFAMFDLLEQAREFSKALKWYDRLYKASPLGYSLMDQAELEIKNLARADREIVLEPYRWLFHGGASGEMTWINNETPSGTINGINAAFTLAAVPSPTSSVILTKNGQILYNGTGYTLSGATITFATLYIPRAAFADSPIDQIRAWYQIA